MKLTVRTHMMTTLGVVVALLATLLAVTVNMTSEAERLGQLQAAHSKAVDTVQDFKFRVAQVQQFLTDVSATGDEGGYGEAAVHRAAGLEDLAAIRQSRPDLAARVEGVEARFKTFDEVGRQMAAIYVAEGREAGNAMMKAPGTGFDARAEALVEAMTPLIETIEADRQALGERFGDELSLGAGLIVALELLILAVGGGMLWHLALRIFRNLGGEPEVARDIADRIANGDLVQELNVGNAPDGSLLASMARMQTRLREFVRTTHLAIHNLNDVSAGLAAAGSRLSGASHDASGATSAMAATVTQLAHNLEEIAGNASGARETSESSGKLADEGRRFMTQTSQDMTRIESATHEASAGLARLSQASDAISRVIDMIREVADQTNLLALNAAIEAARAGESGRGFAVVADEVRKLAERTASSTNEIQHLVSEVRQTSEAAIHTITDVVGRVQDGSARARAADQAMADIHAQTGRVVAMVASISQSLSEQEAAHTDLVQRMGGLADSSEHNSMAAGDLSSHASRMQSLAAELRQTVEWMRV